MRLSRLEKNNKAIEETIYRDKHNRNKMKKTADRETYSKFLKGPTQYIIDRSNSNFEMIKKGNSYSITKITTATIKNQNDHVKEPNYSNNNTRLVTKTAVNQDSDNFIVNIVRKEKRDNNIINKTLTNSTTADIHSNCSDNSNSQCRMKSAFIKRKNSNSANSRESIKEIDTKSREFDIANEKVTSPKSVSENNKNTANNNNPKSSNNVQTNNNVSNNLNSNIIQQQLKEKPSDEFSSTLCAKFDKVVSDFTSKIEYIKKTSTLDLIVTDNISLEKMNEIEIKKEKCSKQVNSNKHYNSNNPNNEAIPEENDCLCGICCNGEVSEAYLANQIYHIIYDIYDCHIKNDKIQETIQKYKKLVYGFCTIEDKKEIVFFIKLFDDKVKSAFRVRKKYLYFLGSKKNYLSKK
ncbi:MAG: hypothetical protein ACK5YA_00240 [bacterium]